MTAVFVHGVPDTHRMWDGLLTELASVEPVTLALPGFGTPTPAGFEATKEAYAAWVTEQLTALGEPVDLVGHDWGAILVQYVASTRPELVRTLAVADGAVDTEYEWHDLAQAWQTPEVGEQVMEAMSGDALVAGLADAGHPDAETAAASIDDRMKHCILRLYRSAVNVGAEWQPAVERNTRPALVLWGRDDPYAPAQPYGERLAARAGADLVVLDGGHWAIVE